jgi:hypothetical protein
MRPGTVITLGALLLVIFVAGIVEFFLLLR